MLIPTWFEEKYLERGWSHCRGGKDKPFTPKVVPFAMKLEQTRNGRNAFIERRDFARGLSAVFKLVAGLTLLLLLLLVVTMGLGGRGPAPVHILAIVGNGGIATCVYLIIQHHRNRHRELALGPKAQSLTVQTVSSEGLLISETGAPLSDCSATVHKVTLNTRRGLTWSGWAVVVRVSDRSMALACLKDRGEIDDYVLAMPEWLKSVYKGEGEPIQGLMTDVWIGRAREVPK